MQKKWVGFLMSAVAAATLVACGGGSSSSPTTLSGEVIDGYIEGAIVCLDENGDGACGSSEPRAVTGANGSFNLSVTGSTEGKFIVVEVPATAKDSDDGGKTLAEAGKSAYVMATPAAAPQVVSPLTTLLAGKIKADGLSLAEARTRVLDELGLPAGTDLHVDHVEAENVQVHAMARQVAARLQEAKTQAQGHQQVAVSADQHTIDHPLHEKRRQQHEGFKRQRQHKNLHQRPFKPGHRSE